MDNINNILIKDNPLTWDETEHTETTQLLKILIFNIGNITFGISIDQIYKVVSSAQIYSSEGNWVGVSHIGEREVTVLDLQKKFFHPHTQQGYLIIIQYTDNELYGILVETVPALIDVPLSQIRVLPPSFRHADALGIASHVAIINDQDTTQTIFLLDLVATLKFLQ
ncbi:MAG TPA: chemotaxis protein CheW [Allocoleopsis sp.]